MVATLCLNFSQPQEANEFQSCLKDYFALHVFGGQNMNFHGMAAYMKQW